MYRKSQFGTTLVGILFVPLIAIIIINFTIQKKSIYILASVLIFFIIIILLFFKLSIHVNKERIRISFGIGIIKKSFIVNEIISCKIVKNPWYYSWGIHTTPKGWIYNVSGSRGIEIEMKNGRVYRIGSPEPEKLCEAINNAMK